jgi:hypothetical protein
VDRPTFKYIQTKRRHWLQSKPGVTRHRLLTGFFMVEH